MDRWEAATLDYINEVRAFLWGPNTDRLNCIPKGLHIVGFDPISNGIMQDVIGDDLEIETWPMGWAMPDGVYLLDCRAQDEYACFTLPTDVDFFLKRYIAHHYPEYELGTGLNETTN